MRIVLLLTLLLAPPALAGGGDVAVTSGVIAHEQGDHAQALAKLDEALQYPAQLKPKNVAKAYFYRAEARIGAYTAAASTPDRAEAMRRLQALGQDPLIQSAEDYETARKKDASRWGKRVDIALMNLRQNLLQTGLSSLQQAQTSDNDSVKKSMTAQAIRHLAAAIRLDADDYLAYNLRGQARLELAGGITGADAEGAAGAYEDFQTAVQRYASSPPPLPDLLFGYAYYRLALIDRYLKDDLDEALQWTERGKNTLDAEFSRLDRNRYTPDQWAQLEAQHAAVRRDLNNFELDVYLNFPAKREAALIRFETALREEADNALLWLAYGSLLEQGGRYTEAIAAYEKAYNVDPTSGNAAAAAFNLGAVHNNLAARWMKRSNEVEDLERAQDLINKGNAELENAAPWLEKALKLQPTNTSVLRALKNIYATLGRMDDYKRIKAAEDALGGR